MNNLTTPFPPPHRQSTLLYGLAASGLACLAVAAVAAGPNLKLSRQSPVVANAQEVSQAFTEVTKHVAPAVVYIQVEKKPSGSGPMTQFDDWQSPFNDEFLKRFFGDKLPKFEMPKHAPQRPWSTMGQGSGFIISEDGYILTNAHVIRSADRVAVTLADGRQFEAEIIGKDRSSDIAVVKIDAQNLPMITMGNSDDIEVGEWVMAIGSPFGLPGTVTSGIISAQGRSSVGIADYENFIQTDAAINPGNSGGPLVNLNGEAIGINTAIFSRSGGYMGIGFAIPINMARDICDQLIEDGSVTRGYLGIAIQELTPELASSFEIDETDGVLVSDVTQDSPAEKAGLRSGDVIVEFDGHRIKDVGPLRNGVASTTPESNVNVVVLRDGERRVLTLSVGTLPSSLVSSDSAVAGSEALGFQVAPLNEELKVRYGYRDAAGVVITHVQSSSLAARAGLQAGMLIKEVNRQPIRNMDEFNEAIGDGESSVLLLVQKDGYSRYVALSLPK